MKTPALDKTLCDRCGVLPLEFDGHFQPYDRASCRHMEYLLDRSVHADVPVAEIMAIFDASNRASGTKRRRADLGKIGCDRDLHRLRL